MVIGRWTFARGGMLAATALAAVGLSSGCGSGAITGKPGDGGARDASGRDASSKDTKADAPQQGDSRPTGMLPVGHTCGAGGDCLSGFCADGFCCATDCSAACQTCAAAGHIGTCIPADVGSDPRNDCQDMGAATCGTDGFCDGAGACEKYVAGVTCQQAGCTGASLTFAGRCDGLGTCVTTPAQSCAPFTCAASGQCKTTCTADTDCATGAICLNGSCGKQPIGASCGADADCNSGICAQGTCCMTACDGLCRSCGINGSAGVCTNVPAGQDPLGQCADNGTTSCGTDGFCDGNGACQSYSSTTSCGMDSCAGGTETPAARCDGVGDCVSGTPTGCAPYVCGAGGDCKTSCATDADCASGASCSGTICCMPGQCAGGALGATCNGAGDCASGFCQQSVCCASSCTGTCQSCALSGSAGTCTNVPLGQDPLAACTDAGAATCGTNGFCDGSGKCQLYTAGTICGAATCATGTATAARTCDGAGICRSATPSSCAPYACNAAGTACNTTCAGNADCAASVTCNTSTNSCGLAPNGTTCTSGTTCNSGVCAQSVCCATACSAVCSSCAVAGSIGTCVAVPAGQDPLAQCADAGATTCGLNGFCNGSGACQKYSAGTGCASAACTGSTFTPAASCDGNGTCAKTTSSCAPYVCGSGACKTTCATSADCVSPNVCTAGICAAGCPGVYCDNFEADTVGAMAIGWTREGGSTGDWQVISDATKAFAQNHAQSATFRLAYASSAAGAPWSGATSVTASVKVLALGTSGTTTAFVCLRYTGGGTGDYACLALEPGIGARVQMRNAGTVVNGPLWTPTLAVGTWYTTVLSASASGTLSASVDGTALGTFTPATAVPGGFVAVATQSAEAAFDNLVVTQP